MDREKIIKKLAHAGDLRMVVCGDYTLDKYLYIDPDRDEPSVETGLTAYQVDEKRCFAGAGGTITNNLRALGVQVTCIGLLGSDGEGFDLERCLLEEGADLSRMVRTKQLCTCTYTKPMRRRPDGSAVEMNRLDFRNFSPPSTQLQNALLRNLEDALPGADGVILIDQFSQRNLGAVTDFIREKTGELASRHPELLFYADSRAFPGECRNMVVKCNQFEFLSIGGKSGGDPNDLPALLRKWGELGGRRGHPFFVTRGPAGMVVFEGNQARVIPAYPISGPTDPVGAGDAANAGIALGLALGLTAPEAAVLACCISSITIQQLGRTGTATMPQLIERLKNYREGDVL